MCAGTIKDISKQIHVVDIACKISVLYHHNINWFNKCSFLILQSFIGILWIENEQFMIPLMNSRMTWDQKYNCKGYIHVTFYFNILIFLRVKTLKSTKVMIKHDTSFFSNIYDMNEAHQKIMSVDFSCYSLNVSFSSFLFLVLPIVSSCNES